MDFFVRIASLVKKELLAVLRDKKSRMALIIPPVIQICIFGYAATMNVTRVPYVVLDKDGGETAAQYIADREGLYLLIINILMNIMFSFLYSSFPTLRVMLLISTT